MNKIDLSKSQKEKFAAIMSEGNSTWIALCSQTDLNRKKFRNQLFQKLGNQARRFAILGITIKKSDAQKILEVRKIEMDMIQGYMGLCNRLANHYKSFEYPFEDLQSEAMYFLIQAIYNYTDTNIQFSTYAHISINRGLIKAINPHYTKRERLQIAFLEMKSSHPELNRNEIIQKMKLTEEEVKIFNDNKKVILSSSLSDEKGDGITDYSQIRFITSDDYKDPLEIKDELEVLMEKANLTESERKLFETFLFYNGENGWQTWFAEEHVNPKTGKKYSRMSATNFWRSACKKMKKARQLVA